MLKQKEKKYSIAQKRLESMRLVSALLNKVKDVAVASKQIGNPLPELENERKVWSFKSQTLDAPKEKVNFLGQQETESKKESGYQLSDLAEASVEEKAQYIPCSRHVLQRNISNRSVAGNYTVSLKVKDTDSHNLKISETQNSGFLKSCYQGDCLGPNTRHFFKPSSVCNSKKLKVYETDEFIHYLLNYYQAPTYSRVIPGLHDPVDTSWQRVVHTAKHQKKEDEQSMMDLSCLANTQEKSPKGSDNWEVTVEEPGVMPESQPRAREFAKNSQVCYKNLSDEAIEGILHGEMNSLPLVSATYDRKSQADDTEMIAMASDKPVGHVNKLKDVLEEISSDSELSGVLDESIRERPIENGGGYERVRLVKDLRISVQSVNRYDLICDYMKCNYCQRNFEDFYSEKIRTFLDGTRGILSQEAQRVNLSKSDQEREAGENKKRKRFSDDEPQLFKANHCEELDPLGETQRKYSKMFHHTMLGEVKAEDVPGCLFQEAHQKADNGNVDIHKTSENGCKTDERQRGCKSGAGRGELRQVGEVEEVVGR